MLPSTACPGRGEPQPGPSCVPTKLLGPPISSHSIFQEDRVSRAGDKLPPSYHINVSMNI